jgi:predicted unusual protein kinase regulating ubiquinone biosynthesis (AarF/ABC1/UbiB family)
MAREKIPTSRVARTTRVGRLAAGQAIRQAGTRAANVARSEEGRNAALERRHIEAAEQIVAALGTMKGAAMKLGQVLSFLDVGLVPEPYREEFQHRLAKLRDAAPEVSFTQMRKVIEQDLGGRLGDHFEDFEEDPIAAASIGQVYRAALGDGRRVAVKVQYPGVGDAVRADMRNLALIMRLMKRLAPGLDVKALAEEVRSRVVDELDYELEASNHRTLARIFRGHPFIVIPDVVPSLCRERVIVTEYIEGTGFEELKGRPQQERDRVGEMIYRFYCGCLYRHRRFSGDPHPGNYILLDGGRIAFLDFGLFKRMDDAEVELELACQRAVTEGDGATLHRILSEAGFLPRPELVDPEHLLGYVATAIWWYTTDAEIELTPKLGAEALIESADPRSSYYREMRHQSLRPEHLFGRRMEMLILAVLCQLGARNNWHRIAREWMYGDPPVTELGRREAEFYGGGASRR